MSYTHSWNRTLYRMKNLLLVTYFWPPSGKASVHWPLRMSQHLPSHGWNPVILTVDKDTFSHHDSTSAFAANPDLEVVRAGGVEPFDLYRRFMGKPVGAPLQASEAISRTNTGLRHRISVWIRMNLFVPDARVGWYWSAVRKARKAFSGRSFDAVLSVGPPHTALLVGSKLARVFGAPHIPVLIDPWTDIVYYRGFWRNPVALAVDRALERRVLESAADVVFITQSMRSDYIVKYPAIEPRSHVLYWGYDESPFLTGVRQPLTPHRTMIHAGNIFDYQNPRRFWRTVRSINDTGLDLRLVFIGTVGPEIRESIRAEGLEPKTSYRGFLPYDEMIKELVRADYLMVCASEKRHVPGKLFEYLRSRKPILAFGDDNEEVRTILSEASAGLLVPYDDSAEQFFSRSWGGGPALDVVRKYDRRSIAQDLSGILERSPIS